jgi:Rps23 Pro-64 3,4-dihydroxylase Tpa1-like proline 4-hydroxylase
MNIKTYTKNNLDYIIVDDVYSTDEIVQIKAEIDQLYGYSNNANEVGGASYASFPGTTRQAILLDDYYAMDRNKSSILQLNRRLFNSEIATESIKLNAFYGHIKNCNLDKTLINYYAPGDFYGHHVDSAIITVITFFTRGKFTGGELGFSDYDITIESLENRMVIFPACIKHYTNPIESSDTFAQRISVVQALHYAQ